MGDFDFRVVTVAETTLTSGLTSMAFACEAEHPASVKTIDAVISVDLFI
jgi:hypothetical protein